MLETCYQFCWGVQKINEKIKFIQISWLHTDIISCVVESKIISTKTSTFNSRIFFKYQRYLKMLNLLQSDEVHNIFAHVAVHIFARLCVISIKAL